jgi:putative drug exporter of the RND superfamily
MFERVARFIIRRGRWVLAGTLVAVVIAGALSGGGFSDPNAQSNRGTTPLEEIFDAGGPNLLVLVTTTAGSVDDAAGAALTEGLAREPSVQEAPCSWTDGSAPSLRSHDWIKPSPKDRPGAIGGVPTQLDWSRSSC